MTTHNLNMDGYCLNLADRIEYPAGAAIQNLREILSAFSNLCDCQPLHDLINKGKLETDSYPKKTTQRAIDQMFGIMQDHYADLDDFKAKLIQRYVTFDKETERLNRAQARKLKLITTCIGLSILFVFTGIVIFKQLF